MPVVTLPETNGEVLQKQIHFSRAFKDEKHSPSNPTPITCNMDVHLNRCLGQAVPCPLCQSRPLSPHPLTWHVPDHSLNANLQESHYPTLGKFGTVDCADPVLLRGRLICILTHEYTESRFKRAIHHCCEIKAST